jgi:hypothetical protein
MLPLFVVVVVTVPSASASSPLLVFDRPSAAPHSFVVAKTARRGALAHVRKRTLRLFLGDVRLGRLAVDRKGNGRLRFEVPNVPAGVHPLLLRGLPNGPTSRLVGSYQVVEGTPPVRGCDRSVYGRLDEANIARSLGFGPVKLIGYDPAKAADPSWPQTNPRTGEYGVKVLLLVERDARATLGVAPYDRRLVALTYIPERFNRYRVTGGDAAVNFVACRGDESVGWAGEPWTQFNGGFMFRRPLCAHFELRVEGRPAPIPFALPFGRPCPASEKTVRSGTIAFTRGGWIYTVSSGGGTPTKLVKGSNPAWSPDGTRLAFNRADRLYVSDSNGNGVKKLADDAVGPAWSPEGKRIAFTGTENPFPDCIPTSTYQILWTIGADGTDRKLFTPKAVAEEICSVPGGDTDPSWSPAGKRIVFTHSEYIVHTEYDRRLVVAPVAGKPRTKLRAGAEADWSRSGAIAWTRSFKRVSQIFVSGPTASSKARRLTTDPKGSFEPDWSPDGRTIVFVRSGRLLVLDIKTRKTRRLTAGPNDGAPSWRPLP